MQKISFLAGAGNQKREENSTDAGCGQKHGKKILRHAFTGCVPTAVTFIEVFKVTVNYNDRVVHHHAKHYNHRGKRYGIQRYAHKIHDAQ